jgi:PAS domain-containing protein
MPNTIQSEEYRRLRALRELDLTEDIQSTQCDALVALAATYFNVPIVTISLIDRDNQQFFARVGTTRRSAPREDAVCNLVIAAGAAQVIPDARLDPRTAASSFVTNAPFMRFYAGCPIRSVDGYIVGTFCLFDIKPRGFSDVDLRDFIQFGSLAEAMVSAHSRDIALHKAQATLTEQTKRLTRANSAMAQAERIAKIGHWEVDIATGNVTWSDEVYRIHELEMMGGKSVDKALDFYAVYDRKRVSKAVDDAIADGTAFDFTADLITARGNVRHIRSAGERESGPSPRLIGIVQDVTDLVEAQRSATNDGGMEHRRPPHAA